VVSLQKFGAFVQLTEGVEGMIHVGDISAEKRIDHPQDVLKVGQQVTAKVLELDAAKRRIRLGMKQLVPTGLDEYLGEHKEGDVVTGRVADVSRGRVKVELGEGVFGYLNAGTETAETASKSGEGQVDLSSLTSMLTARWKGGGAAAPGKNEPVRPGQIRSFRIAKLDAGAKRIDVEVAG
jgi:small subunit ribosomal protein S1